MNTKHGKDKILEDIKLAIDKAGNPNKLHKALNISKQSAYNWGKMLDPNFSGRKSFPNSVNYAALQFYLNENSPDVDHEYNDVLGIGINPKYVESLVESKELGKGLMIRRIGAELYIVMQISNIKELPTGSLIVVNNQILKYISIDDQLVITCSSVNNKQQYQFSDQDTDAFLLIARIDQLY